ncbi:MAG: SpoIIE family protein phosphatase [Streptosporangiaceae bacterium]
MAAERRHSLPSPDVARVLGLFVVVAAAYAIGSELSWQSFSSGAAFGFPPAGVTVAALLLVSRRRWPAVVAAIAVAEITIDLQHQLSLAVALASVAANCVEPLVGAWTVNRLCGGRPDLTTRPGLLRFVAGAVCLGPLAGGLIGATVIMRSTGGWWPALWLQWWAGDGIAVLVIGAPILLWAARRPLIAARWRELVLIIALTAGLAVVAFRLGQPPALLFLPLLAWAAFWIGDLAVVLSGTAFAVVANYMTAAGYGEFANLRMSAPAVLAVTQLYIATLVMICWLLAQEVTGRIRAVQERESARMQQAAAEARRMAAELGARLADAATVTQVAERVSEAVRGRLGVEQVAIDLAPDLPDGQADPAEPAEPADLAGAGQADRTTRIPLLGSSGSLGLLAVRWDPVHEPSAAEREYLEAVAETTSRAVERARLRQAEQRERERLATLATLTRLLASALTPPAIGEVVAERVRSAIGGADGLALGVVTADGTRIEWVSSAGYSDRVLAHIVDLPIGDPTAATDAIRSGQPVILRDWAEYARRYPDRAGMVADENGSSWLAWPLTVGKGAVGCISIMWRRPQQFGPGQLAFIAAVADLVAQALVRARIYADEHAIATVLQRAVMPKMTAPIAGLEVGTCYQQAGTTWVIGGDWYDALALAGGQAYLAIGDVAGHGIAAAEDMTQIRNAGRALAIAGYQPARLLAELRRITTAVTAGQFATMAVALVEPAAGRMTYASAGHLPLLVRRAKSGKVDELSAASGPPLGPFEEAAYSQRRTYFAPGDVVLMYTDGLIERRGDDITDGIARISTQLAAWPPGGPLASLCQQLVGALAAQPQLDDICVLAIGRPSLGAGARGGPAVSRPAVSD